VSKIHQAIRKAAREGHLRVGGGSSLAPVREIPSFLADETFVRPGLEESREDKGESHQECLVKLEASADSKLVALTAPKSIPSEQYRGLKTKLFQMRQQREKLKAILVTSAGMADGKTLTAVNLGLTMAHEIDSRVLFVDADLRRPRLHAVLAVRQKPGLSDYLRGTVSLDQILLKSDFHQLHLVTAGSVPDNPAELLNSEPMTRFLTWARERFDWVILDSPPIAALADADLMATKVDGVLFVVRAMHTPADLLENSLRSLEGKNLLGVILNGIEDLKASKYSYYYTYGR